MKAYQVRKPLKNENHYKSQGKEKYSIDIVSGENYGRSSHTSSHPFSNSPSACDPSRKFCRMTPAEVPELVAALLRDLNGKGKL